MIKIINIHIPQPIVNTCLMFINNFVTNAESPLQIQSAALRLRVRRGRVVSAGAQAFAGAAEPTEADRGLARANARPHSVRGEQQRPQDRAQLHAQGVREEREEISDGHVRESGHDRVRRASSPEPDGRVQQVGGLVFDHFRQREARQASGERREEAESQGPVGSAHDLAESRHASVSFALSASLASH